jgi:hypothetical protein
MKKISLTLISLALSFLGVGCTSNKAVTSPNNFSSKAVNQPDTVKNYMQSIVVYQQNKDLSTETERQIALLTDKYIQTKMIIDEAARRQNTSNQ